MIKRLLLLTVWAVGWAAGQTGSQPNATYSYRFTNHSGEPTDGITVYSGATTTIPIDNSRQGCIAFQLTYNSEGFTGVSLNLQTAPKQAGGSPGIYTYGAFSTYGGTATVGTLPMTGTAQGNYVGYGFYPYIRVNLATATGTGSIDVNLSCWRSITYAQSIGGSGGTGCTGSCVTQINGDTTAAQTLAAGTTGSDFAVEDAGAGVHNFNLPTASATKRGALSSGDWTTFNAKQAALGFTAENVANKSTTTTLGTSDTLYPTQNAVKTYVDGHGGGAPTTVTYFTLTDASGTLANSRQWGSDSTFTCTDGGAGLTYICGVNTANVATLAGTQSFTGVKTFSAGPIITEGVTPSVTLNKLTVRSSDHAFCSGNGVSADCYTINPMTTAGDLITGGASGVPAKLAIGSALQYLSVVGGVLAWRSPLSSDISGATTTIASGTSTMATGAISGNACATVVTTAATGTATTDAITWTPNADISGVTGYGITSTDGLKIYPYPSSNNVNFKVCNGTAVSITPGSAIVLNWRVTR